MLPICSLLACLILSAHGVAGRRLTTLSKPRLVVRFLDGSHCNVGKNAISAGKMWLEHKGPSVLSNMDVTISRSASLGRAEVTLVRCADAISFNTCEYFETWKNPATCVFMAMKKMPWSEFFEKSKPPLRCPIKAGNYSYRDVGVDPATLTVFGPMKLDDSMWNVVFKLFDTGDREVYCTNYTIEFRQARS